MILSRKIAINIVDEVNQVVKNKINIMNEEGIIIASSDKSRINTFHKGAYDIIKNQLPQVRVNYDGEFEGALEGLNFPIKIHNYVVGVIGVTGVYDEIKESASIIKRMTELILENAYSVEQKMLQENIRNIYLSEWLNGNEKILDGDFVKKGKTLNFDITIPRRVIACTFYVDNNRGSIRALHMFERAEKAVKNKITCLDPNNIYYDLNSMLICMLTTKSDESIYRICNDIMEYIENKFSVKMNIGIDSKMKDYKSASLALNRAIKANRACIQKNQCNIKYYDDLNMEVFSYELDKGVKWKYINKIFKDYGDEELNETIDLLEVYYNMEGSINKASDKLFIHKNTLQNKLKHIGYRTGYDPRSIKNSSFFLIAIYFYREIK